MALTAPPAAPPAAPSAPGAAPSRSDPATFRALADSFLLWLVEFRDSIASLRTWMASYITWVGTHLTEMTALQSDVAAKQGTASTAASTATAAKNSVAYIYQTLLAVAPTTRPDGTAMQAGDLYTSTAGTTYRRVGSSWVVFTPSDAATRAGVEDIENKSTVNIGSAKVSGYSFYDASSLAKFMAGRFTSGSKFGYGNGGVGSGNSVGGAVTQLTSKSTAVTLDKACGMITTHGQSLAAGAIARFTLNSVFIDNNDLVTVHRRSGGTGSSYRVWCDSTASDACEICIQNISGGALAETLVLSFMVFEKTDS